jgi:iron complex outermembrane receptor protein
MKLRHTPLVAALISVLSANAWAQEAPLKVLGTITITGGRPTSLPTQIPTTIEGVTAQQIEQTVNATDSEDALKYLPSLLVRKRFIGDYNHAVLSTRASGTGNSARSMVYADGILLSNYLGNGAGFAPRWGLVTPEESERDAGKQASVSLGNRSGKFAWWFNLSRLDSTGQPLSFATRMLSDGAAPAAGTPSVTGAIASSSNKGQDWWLLGTTTSYRTVQKQAKLKLAYDLTPTLRASYTYGWWNNDTDGGASSYLRDAAGNPVYSGNVVIAGRQYNLNGPSLAFAPSINQLQQAMHGLSLKSNTRGVFDWEAAASRYDYSKDILRAPTATLPAAFTGGAGRITNMDGTGWHNLNLRATWRPAGIARGAGAQVIEFGYQQDDYRLRNLVSSTADWIHGEAGARFSAFNGNTALKSLFAQDTWTISPLWKTTIGGRYERWHAFGGELSNAATLVKFGPDRSEAHVSPKAALAYQASADWVIKTSVGRAVRMPTVGELYQGSINGNTIVNTDPSLKPEKSWTTELSAERVTDTGMLRATMFLERTRDALYSQALTPTVNTVQNVDAIHTRGVELSWQAADLGLKGLDLNSSLTFTDSVITANKNFPASVGKQQPRVPAWRATTVASYKQGENLWYTLAARYSGKQYGQLDNSDTNSFSYLGFSKFFVVDARVRFKLDKQWSAAIGIDNLNNYKYWAFHPYTQRTAVAELKFDL